MTTLTGDEIRHNERMCLMFEALIQAFFGTSIMATYYEAHHLTPDQIYMLQSILCAVSISSDMPFGRVADLIGVRKMMVFGACFMFLQAIYLARCEEYWEFQIALVLAGIHSGCIKNTTDDNHDVHLQIDQEQERTRRSLRLLPRKEITCRSSCLYHRNLGWWQHGVRGRLELAVLCAACGLHR